jgi:DNA polymerase I-like protein with 3'-5' exonuclease and polymerase domains
MIKNYPVQGFATGDVVPVVLNELHHRLSSMKSCMVNTVHDSTVIDIHPDEKDQVLNMVEDMNKGLTELVESVYGIHMNVPLLLEAKIGPNWLDTVDV